ncbi:MAG: type I DNA topoisomerase [Eubacteriales bacterium]
MATKNLVIVESPSKAKTIEKYLGPGFEVKASMGHIRDLPKSKIGVDFEHEFTPDYQPIKGKEETIKDLKKAVKKSDFVYLATDPDREGEAISWHLKELLGLKDENTFRVTFNEITKKVVNHAVQNPRNIDQNLVDAQQARRILDRIVGYQLSPLLWRKIRRGLSAGRVQSVATRLVAQREAEVSQFVPQEYWSIEVQLNRVAPNIGGFTAQFHGIDKKMELNSYEQTQEIMQKVKADQFSVTKVKRQDKNRSPAPPFTTSTLQQDASRKLGMTPARTMSIAQQLYEGVDIDGQGTTGLITYMRTDSLRLSEEAVSEARTFISSRYGATYCPVTPREYKTKKASQDAHEAIRPSNVTLVPEEIKKSLTAEQFKLYRLIWGRFVACQMTNAIYDSISIDASAGGYIFRASHSALKFSGFTAVYEEGKDDDQSEKAQSPLPNLEEGEPLEHLDTKEVQHFTQPPPRFSEATLIRALEEQGIGRPSTYAPTISTILSREYVVKEGKVLRITPLGEVVTGLMVDKFSNIVDPTFTAKMESELDKVEEGTINWKMVLGEFYTDFTATLEKAESELDGERIKVPEEVSEEICDLCGKNMVVKSGRFGRFLACPGWPDCTFTKPLVVEMPGKCPTCGGRILKKTSRKGYTYYGCEKNFEKDESKRCPFMTWDVPVKDDCPVCAQTMFKKSGRGAKKPYCINETCSNFTPEEKRGGYRKKAANQDTNPLTGEKPEEEPAKKKTTKKTATKTAAKKATTTKTATKKPAEKKAPAKKASADKTTTKKTSTKKATTEGETTKKTPAKKTTTTKIATKKAKTTKEETI